MVVNMFLEYFNRAWIGLKCKNTSKRKSLRESHIVLSEMSADFNYGWISSVNNNLEHIKKEYSILKKEYDNKLKSDEKLNDLYSSLKEINAKLWVIEDEKRLCEKNSDFGEKFIKLSRDVHFLNDKRADIKLLINNHTGSKIKEIKEYTKY